MPTVKLWVENNNLMCVPTVLRTSADQQITFESRSGQRIMLQAKGVSPFDKAILDSAMDKLTDLPFRRGVAPGAYSLACVVIVSEKLIYMDPSCPSIIVE